MSARTRWDRDAVIAHIKRVTATAPPLTDEQRNRLAALLAPTPPSRQDGDRADAA